MTEALVLDASAMVEMLVGRSHADSIAARLRGSEVHVPAHFDAEVMSALGRMHRGHRLKPLQVARGLDSAARAPFERHALAPLLSVAWDRSRNARLVDALYIALSERLSLPLVTLDRGLARAAPRGELLET